MTSLEERITKLEQQMKKRIERHNFFARLIADQFQMQFTTLDLLMQSAPSQFPFEKLAKHLTEQHEQWQQDLSALAQDDEPAQQYMQQLLSQVDELQSRLQLIEQIVKQHNLP